jgi:calcium-dependent protein kinase
MMYLMITGDYPFKGHDRDKLFKQITSIEIKVDKGVFLKRSDDCRDLILRLLERDSNKRITLTEAINHPWLSKAHHEPIEIDEEVILTLREFKAKSRFQQEATSILI